MGRWVLALVTGLAMAAGCGPVAYVNQVTRHADSAVERARDVKADKLAPYWYTRAVEYLHMARDVAGHADFQGANRFGRLSEEAALKAVEQASDPKLRWTDPLEGMRGSGAVAPAKTDAAPASDAAPAPAKDPAPAKEGTP